MTSLTRALCLPGTWLTLAQILGPYHRSDFVQRIPMDHIHRLQKHRKHSPCSCTQSPWGCTGGEKVKCPWDNHTRWLVGTGVMTIPSLKDKGAGASCPDLENIAPFSKCRVFICNVVLFSEFLKHPLDQRMHNGGPQLVKGSLTFGRQYTCSLPWRY